MRIHVIMSGTMVPERHGTETCLEFCHRGVFISGENMDLGRGELRKREEK